MSLLDGRPMSMRSDTADMVAARVRVHRAGVLDGVVAGVGEIGADWRQASSGRPIIVDLGSGPGHYLHAALAHAPADARGLGIDLSKYCARTLARTVDRAAAVVADVWRRLPLADGIATEVLSVFAPRNVSETLRILAPGGIWVIVTPRRDHLAELIEPMGMLSIATDKAEQVAEAVAPAFEVIDHREIVYRHDCDAQVIGDLVGMGPSAFHRTTREIADAAAALTNGGTTALPVTVAVTATVCRPAQRIDAS